MVPMRTMKATKAPTATPMITATGSDSADDKAKPPTITQQGQGESIQKIITSGTTAAFSRKYRPPASNGTTAVSFRAARRSRDYCSRRPRKSIYTSAREQVTRDTCVRAASGSYTTGVSPLAAPIEAHTPLFFWTIPESNQSSVHFDKQRKMPYACVPAFVASIERVFARQSGFEPLF